MFTIKRIFLTSFSGNRHDVGIMYKNGLSIHKNGFAMTFGNVSFIPEILGLFVLFAITASIV